MSSDSNRLKSISLRASLITTVITVFFAQMCHCHSEHSEETEIEKMDLSKITWAHAVNSRNELEDALNGDVNLLEADISIGHVLGKEAGPDVPIMAHPPDVISDISFEQWLDLTITRATGKGVKLDFKSIRAVEPTLETLKKHERKVSFPLWLNADILPGPVNSTKIPVSAFEFINSCVNHFPGATLSVGWTTYWFETFDPATWHYGWNDVRAMADTLECSDFESSSTPLTFPVRAVFACRSIPQLQWLLDRFPTSTLTVWSGNKDSVVVDDLLKIREAFGSSRVYYDVPENLRRGFEVRKDERVTPVSITSHASSEWITVATDDDLSDRVLCPSNVYADSHTLMFGKNATSALLSTKTFKVEDGTKLKIEGKVTFFLSRENGTLMTTSSAKHQLVLVLSDISDLPEYSMKSDERPADKKNENGNTLIAMNGSRLHTFEHVFTSSPLSCHFFRLDTTAERKFQAWTIPCDLMSDVITDKDVLEQGTAEVPRSMRLVLPPGPVKFGFISSGDGNVLVHELNIQGDEIISGSESLTSSAIVISVMLVTLAVVIL